MRAAEGAQLRRPANRRLHATARKGVLAGTRAPAACLASNSNALPPPLPPPPSPSPCSTSRAEFVACGLRKRNVGAFLNHSCAPNCFVQPVLDTHHDTRCPKICIFASGGLGSTAAACCYLAGWNLCSRMLQGRSLSAGLRGSTGLACLMRADNIAPMTELTLDYGEAYAAGFRGGCKCGAADCISQRIPRAATATVAVSPTACPLAAAAPAPASRSRAATSSDD